MSEVQRLRLQADKARRLAGAVNDVVSKDALARYADDCDAHADRLQVLEDEERRRRPD
jgi:hypothetical protein